LAKDHTYVFVCAALVQHRRIALVQRAARGVVEVTVHTAGKRRHVVQPTEGHGTGLGRGFVGTALEQHVDPTQQARVTLSGIAPGGAAHDPDVGRIGVVGHGVVVVEVFLLWQLELVHQVLVIGGGASRVRRAA
jgi:hypothetical protein